MSHRGEPATAATPAVVLVGRQRDPELGAVENTLRRAGVPCLRIDLEWLDDLQVVFTPGGALTIAGQTVSPTVVWARDLSPRAIPSHPSENPGVFADDTSWAVSTRAAPGDDSGIEATFVGDSRVTFLAQLAHVSPAFIPGRAPGRLRQLADARRCGIRVPDTIVATDPAAAPSSWRRVVVKAIDEHYVEYPAGSLSWYWPRIWDRKDTVPWPRVGVPAILQEYVPHTAEFRVFFLDGKLCAFQVDKQLPTDLWLAVDRVAVKPVLPPPAIRVAVTTLAQAWGLTYGAFDFLSDGHEPIFLEVNVDGGWRWFERRAAATPVTTTAGAVVAKLHRAIAGSHHHRGDGRVDLVALLAGRAEQT